MICPGISGNYKVEPELVGRNNMTSFRHLTEPEIAK